MLALASLPVERVLAEAMSAWQWVMLALQLVWVQKQPVLPPASIEAPMPVWASAQESLVSRNFLCLSRSPAFQVHSYAAVRAQLATFLWLVRC